MTMNCKRCGAPIPADAKVCQNCGLEKPVLYWQYPNSTSSNSVKKTANQNHYQNNTQQNSSNSRTYQSNATSNSAPYVQKQNPSAPNPLKKAEKSSLKKFAAILAAVLIIGFVLLISNNSIRLKGTWEFEDGSYVVTFSDGENGYFSADGISYSYSQSVINFTYYIDGDELELKTEETLFENSVVMRFEFDISGNKLTLKDIDSGEIFVHYKMNN